MLKPLFCCDDYLVSDEGYVLSKRGKPLKYSLNHRGYCIIQIMINGKRKGISVHTAVARTFMPEDYKEGLQVNHIDGNKRNNKLSNLEYTTPLENVRHCINVLHKDNKKSNNHNAKSIRAYNEQKSIEFESLIEGAEYLNKCLQYNSQEDYKKLRNIERCIYKALNGYLKTYRGYKWEYT